MRSRQLAVVLLTVAATVLSLGGPAQARAAVEPYTPYQPQVSCDPHVKAGTAAFRSLMFRRFGHRRDLGVVRSCGYGGLSEHKEGRAWDWGLNYRNKADRATAREAITWLTEPVRDEPAARARRLGVMYMIWNKRIWSPYSTDGWRPYDGASPHRDHIHFSFTWNGATKRVSWWTKRVMPIDYGPCPRWIGEYARVWHGPRLEPCPPAIRRPRAVRGMYRVQYGDTVARIARYFDVAEAKLYRWNELVDGVDLTVGQKVRVVAP